MRKLILFFPISVVVLSGCQFISAMKSEEYEESVITHNFESPDEFLENPDIADAILESNFSINYGSTPPNIEGSYTLAGSVVNASQSSLIGTAMGSIIEFYNQVLDNLDLRETVGTQVATAEGSFIIGNYGRFTIFEESKQNYDDGYVYVALLMSGTLYDSGTIDAYTLTTITEVEGIEGAEAGGWYKGDVTLTPKTVIENDAAFESSLEAEGSYYSASNAKITFTWNEPDDTTNVLGYRLYRDDSHCATSTQTSISYYELWNIYAEFYIIIVDLDGYEQESTNTVQISTYTSPPTVTYPGNGNISGGIAEDSVNDGALGFLIGESWRE